MQSFDGYKSTLFSLLSHIISLQKICSPLAIYFPVSAMSVSTPSAEPMELQRRPSAGSDTNSISHNNVHHGGTEDQQSLSTARLPPTDHGKDAYLVLAGCSLIQAPVWGKSYDSSTSC